MDDTINKLLQEKNELKQKINSWSYKSDLYKQTFIIKKLKEKLDDTPDLISENLLQTFEKFTDVKNRLIEVGKFKYDLEMPEFKEEDDFIEIEELKDQGFYFGETVQGIPHGFGIFLHTDRQLVRMGYFIKGKRHGYFTSIGMMMDKDDRIKAEPTLPYVNYGKFKKDIPIGASKIYTIKSEMTIDWEGKDSGIFIEKDLVRKEIKYRRFQDGINKHKGFGFD